MLIYSQLACQTVIQPTEAASTPTVGRTEALSTPTIGSTEIPQFSDEEIEAGIQDSLDLYAKAYNENRPELLEQVLDQENKPFRRIVRSRFDDDQASSFAGSFDYRFALVKIRRREFGYVIAHFQLWDSYEADWPFRFVDGRWVLTEPGIEQVGEPIKSESEHFIFTTYPWAEDFNQQIMDMMETARSNVEHVLGKVPGEKANVSIMPIYGLSPFNPMNAIALYNMNQGSIKDVIEIYTPESFAYSFSDSSLGWDGTLLKTLTHEYTHMTHARSFGKAGRLADWMSEGLAEYVSGATENTFYACDALHSGTVIPILDESDAVYKQDLMHMYLLEKDFGLSYNFATSLVEFTVEKHGGLDGFWDLANTLDKTSEFKKAVKESFGISYDEYNQGWQKWLKKQC